MLAGLLAATGLLVLLTVAPGPDMAVVTRRALVHGRRDALLTSGGIVAGLLCWGGLTVLGLSALLAASPPAYLGLKVLGIGYLVWLAVQSLRGRPGPDAASEAAPERAGRGFVVGLTTNLLNPKIAVFYSALLPTLAPPGMARPLALSVLVLIHVTVTLLWLGGYAYALTRARRVFERPRVRRGLERVTGVVLLGFAARLAVDLR